MSGWNFPLWPERASIFASKVDALYIFLVTLCSAIGIAIFVLLIYFAVKYRSTKLRPAVQIEGSTTLEITWSVVPLFIFLAIFVWGSAVYFEANRPPRDAEPIYVVARQWMWKLQHLDGTREINELHVPVGRDIRLVMTSQDVIHSFFVPAFRIKADVLPGRYTTVWFHATKPGRYHLFCAEYCGTQHSGMIGSVVAMSPQQYQEWLSGGGAEGSLASNGMKLFQELGCATCHRGDSEARGPNLAGLYGRAVHLADGRTLAAEDNYLRESILNPRAKVVAGFQPIMPSFQSQVSEEGVMALIEYIKSLASQQPGGPVANRPVPAEAPPAGRKVK